MPLRSQCLSEPMQFVRVVEVHGVDLKSARPRGGNHRSARKMVGQFEVFLNGFTIRRRNVLESTVILHLRLDIGRKRQLTDEKRLIEYGSKWIHDSISAFSSCYSTNRDYPQPAVANGQIPNANDSETRIIGPDAASIASHDPLRFRSVCR